MSESVSRRFTVGILGASFETNNLGVAALACGTVASICHAHPDARIFLVDYAKEPASYQVSVPGGFASIELVNIRFSKRFYLRNNIAYLLFLGLFLRMLPSEERRTRFLRRNHVLKAIEEADIVVSLSGGDSFSDIYGLRRLIYVTLPQILVLLLGKPLAHLPQTFGPFKGTLARAVARSILKHSRMVYTRDREGLELVRGLVGSDHKRLAFGYDMGFALEPHIRNERVPSWLVEYDSSIPLVGLNVSGLLYMGGYTRSNMFGIKADYRGLIQDLVDFFIRERSVHIMLVPHVFETGEEGESDAIACRQIYEDTMNSLRKHLHLLEEKYDQHEIKALIGRCDFFVGSRMHACIAAMSQCVPAVGLAYSRKFHGVFESVGMEKCVIDIRKFDADAVVAAVDQNFRRGRELRAKLEATISVVKMSVLSLFNQIPVVH